jgi:hypothetical protein
MIQSWVQNWMVYVNPQEAFVFVPAEQKVSLPVISKSGDLTKSKNERLYSHLLVQVLI